MSVIEDKFARIRDRLMRVIIDNSLRVGQSNRPSLVNSVMLLLLLRFVEMLCSLQFAICCRMSTTALLRHDRG